MTKYDSCRQLVYPMLGLLCAALMAGGCGSREKEVTFQSGGMTHTFAEGEGSIPHDFPLPIYPGASTTGSVSASADKGSDEAKFLVLSSPDPMQKVSDYYQKELAQAGWKVENMQALPNLTNIAARKAELEGNVMVASDQDKTTISLAVSKSPPDGEAPEDTGQEYTPDKLTPPTD